MEVEWIIWTTCCLYLISILVSPAVSHKAKPPLRHCKERDVCRTSLKYKDETVADEGLLCKCSPEDDADGKGSSENCVGKWSNEDERTLTWQHYERAHWHVQYRFCKHVFPYRQVCSEESLAAVVETDVKSWRPQLSQPRCACRESFKLAGWKREGKMWRYYYYCEKPECPNPADALGEPSVCAKIYIDPYRTSDMVNEMRFLCNCPPNYMCDAKFDEKEDTHDIQSDKDGRYVVKLCELILQKRLKSN